MKKPVIILIYIVLFSLTFYFFNSFILNVPENFQKAQIKKYAEEIKNHENLTPLSKDVYFFNTLDEYAKENNINKENIKKNKWTAHNNNLIYFLQTDENKYIIGFNRDQVSKDFNQILFRSANFIFFMIVLTLFIGFTIFLFALQSRDDLKKSRDLYHNLENRFNITIKNIFEAILITDVDGKILDLNDEALKILQSKSQDILGQRLQDIIYVSDDENSVDFIELFNNVIEHRKFYQLKNIKLYIPNSKNVRLVDDSLSPLIDNYDKVVGSILIFRDVTSNVEMRDKIEGLKQKKDQLERIELMGNFISGVSHNFANIMTVLDGNIRMIETSLDEQTLEKLENNFKKIREKIEETKMFINKLSIFNQKTYFERIPTDINTLVERNKITLLKIFSPELKLNLDLKSEKTILIDLADFDRILLTILSMFEKETDVELTIRTYDGKKVVILDILGQPRINSMNKIFEISEILERNNITMDEKYEDNLLKIKLFFKI